MRKLIGYLLMGLGFLLFWPLQIGLALFGLFYIVTTFLDAGIVAGLVSIPVVGIILAIIGFIIHILAAPYIALVAFLLEGKSKWEQEAEEIWGSYDRELAEADENKRAEIEWRISHWRRFMEDGLSPTEADNRARRLNYEVWARVEAGSENL